jgi:AmmeMemoRadiSam system protein B
MQADSRTRPTAVAGLFYPSDPDLLRTQVLDLLADVAVSQSMPKALIAPHAGYAYSGRVAAAAFATLRDSAQTITRVVLIGPAHYLQVRGIAGPTVDAFETPLGRVPIDVEALRKIADLPFVIRADAPHAPEHALEVELPFLQTLLRSFQLVPLVVGDAAPQDVAHVLRQLWAGLETLIVVAPIYPIIIGTRPRDVWIWQPLLPLSGATGPVLAQTKLVAASQ